MSRLRSLAGVVAVVALLLSGMLAACSRQAEQVSAEEMAEQMEAAKEGREAARAIITKNWTDTMRLQEAILNARAANSKYELEGKTACKASFDTAFYNTIRTVRPDLADQLQK